MSRDRPRIDRLTAEHEAATFGSGVAELDDWIHRHAIAAQAMDSARTFVVVRLTSRDTLARPRTPVGSRPVTAAPTQEAAT